MARPVPTYFNDFAWNQRLQAWSARAIAIRTGNEASRAFIRYSYAERLALWNEYHRSVSLQAFWGRFQSEVGTTYDKLLRSALEQASRSHKISIYRNTIPGIRGVLEGIEDDIRRASKSDEAFDKKASKKAAQGIAADRERFTRRYDAQGNVIGGGISRESVNAPTPEQLATKRLDDEAARRTRATYVAKETQRILNKSLLASSTRQVSLEFFKLVNAKNILTTPELRATIAAAFASLQSAAYTAIMEQYLEIALEVDKRYQYYGLVSRLMQIPMYLFLDESSLMDAVSKAPELMSEISFRVKGEVITRMYSSLEQAFREAWGGSDNTDSFGGGFPKEYKKQIIKCIEWSAKNDPFVLNTPGGSASGRATIQPWSVEVDFDKIFGPYTDFKKAFHFGAVLANGQSRVERLPYRGQKLLNTPYARYQYWLAIWENKRRYSPMGSKMLYPEEDSKLRWSKQDHMKLTKERIARTEEKIDKIISDQTTLTRELSRRQAESRNIRRQKEQRRLKNQGKWKTGDDVPTDTIQGKLFLTEEALLKQKRRLDYAKNTESDWSRTIPPGLRAKTIAARMSYFNSGKRPRAPFWVLLEFGQIRWQPKVPPRGVYMRFMQLAQREITDLAYKVNRVSIGKKTGYTVDKSGRLRVGARPGPNESGYLITGVSRGGVLSSVSQKPGTFLPRVLNPKRDFVGITKTVQRNVSSTMRDNPAAARANLFRINYVQTVANTFFEEEIRHIDWSAAPNRGPVSNILPRNQTGTGSSTIGGIVHPQFSMTTRPATYSGPRGVSGGSEDPFLGLGSNIYRGSGAIPKEIEDKYRKIVYVGIGGYSQRVRRR